MPILKRVATAMTPYLYSYTALSTNYHYDVCSGFYSENIYV